MNYKDLAVGKDKEIKGAHLAAIIELHIPNPYYHKRLELFFFNVVIRLLILKWYMFKKIIFFPYN